LKILAGGFTAFAAGVFVVDLKLHSRIGGGGSAAGAAFEMIAL
jgi:hypothetical protein